MPQSPNPLSDDTSDRLYTPEELSAFAAAEAARANADPDPLAAPPAPPAAGASRWEAAPRQQPPADPIGNAAVPGGPPTPPSPRRAGPPPSGPPPSGPPPSGPPPGRPGGSHSAPVGVTPPARPPAAGPAPARSEAPPAPPAQPRSTPVDPAPAGEPRRLTSATDFLDRRADAVEPGPATWGWQGKVRRWSGGLIKPRMSVPEQEYEGDRSTLQRDFDGPRTIAFINPKGGAAKTTGVLATGFTFGTVRGGGVVAWDNNETRGTLGIRGTRSAHQNTTRELLADLTRFNDVSQSRLGDLAAFVRSQGDAHFDVLASDERPDVTGQIHAEDFNAIHQLMERFYRIILVDTGNNMRAENWLAAADAADLLVVTSTVREDTGYSGLWMLDALQDAGYQNLKSKTVTVLSDPSPTVDQGLANDLVDVYEQRTRSVFRVPYDPILVAGGVVPYNQLSPATRMSWLRACAGMAEAL